MQYVFSAGISSACCSLLALTTLFGAVLILVLTGVTVSCVQENNRHDSDVVGDKDQG